MLTEIGMIFSFIDSDHPEPEQTWTERHHDNGMERPAHIHHLLSSEKIAQRGYGVSLIRDIQKPPVHNPRQWALGCPCFSKDVGLDDPPFQPDPLCDPVKAGLHSETTNTIISLLDSYEVSSEKAVPQGDLPILSVLLYLLSTGQLRVKVACLENYLLGKNNPLQQYIPRANWLESSFAEDNLAILVDIKLTMSQQCVTLWPYQDQCSLPQEAEYVQGVEGVILSLYSSLVRQLE
ncbi:hypothetical protein BTVI_81445 [Pitangus sulphuratus]|nr:hypothetical protein BTVI_81445 [Pitangus sulphuratus]